MPDLNVTVEHIVAEGNWAAAVYAISGTFSRNMVLTDGSIISPTNLAMQLLGIAFFHFDENGLLTEVREMYDGLSFLGQIGLMTPPEGVTGP